MALTALSAVPLATCALARAVRAVRCVHVRKIGSVPENPRDFFGCSQEDLDRRDAAISASRAKHDLHRSKELSLGPPIGRKIYVSNLRSKDGRKRVPKLTILDSEGTKWMTLTKADVEQIMKWKDELNKELIKYQKKLE
eukprot:s2736_g7.t1